MCRSALRGYIDGVGDEGSRASACVGSVGGVQPGGPSRHLEADEPIRGGVNSPVRDIPRSVEGTVAVGGDLSTTTRFRTLHNHPGWPLQLLRTYVGCLRDRCRRSHLWGMVGDLHGDVGRTRLSTNRDRKWHPVALVELPSAAGLARRSVDLGNRGLPAAVRDLKAQTGAITSTSFPSGSST
jgi:hypothetical protein